MSRESARNEVFLHSLFSRRRVTRSLGTVIRLADGGSEESMSQSIELGAETTG